MSSTFYWFSATGNSLFAAKILSEKMTDTTLVSMTAAPAAEPVGGGSHVIGFVFPSYYGELPRAVRAFVEGLNILPGTDLVAVVTMGAFGQGSVKTLSELLTARGHTLRYGVAVRMPSNYILSYDPALFGAKSPVRVAKKLDKARRKLERISADIACGMQKLETNKISAKNLYQNVAALDEAFTVTGACTGCGLCERLCPVGNIALVDGKPAWLHHCEHCVACISWCPAAAIEYGEKTKRRTRYRNPQIKPAELERK